MKQGRTEGRKEGRTDGRKEGRKEETETKEYNKRHIIDNLKLKSAVIVTLTDNYLL